MGSTTTATRRPASGAGRERVSFVRKNVRRTTTDDGRRKLKMAKLLDEVESNRYWKEWGYDSFRTFVERECSISIRQARDMLRVLRSFRDHLPAGLLCRINWSKAVVVAGIVTSDNAREVFRDMEKMTYAELRHKARGAVEGKTPPAPQALVARPADWLLSRPAEDDFYVEPDVWEQLCFAIAHEGRVLLKGPSGCGKSELCYRAAAAAGRKLAAFNCGAMTEPRSTLIGNTHFDRERGTWFAQSRFVAAVTAARGTVLLDEISRAGRDAFNILLPLMDAQGYLALDESEDGLTICRAADVVFLATANLGMEFTGADELDKALKDRFRITIDLTFPPPAKEARLLRSRHNGLNENDAMRLVNIARRQREMAGEGEFIELISTRALLAAAEQLAAGLKFDRVVRYCLINQFSAEGGDASERAKLAQIVQKFG